MPCSLVVPRMAVEAPCGYTDTRAFGMAACCGSTAVIEREGVCANDNVPDKKITIIVKANRVGVEFAREVGRSPSTLTRRFASPSPRGRGIFLISLFMYSFHY